MQMKQKDRQKQKQLLKRIQVEGDTEETKIQVETGRNLAADAAKIQVETHAGDLKERQEEKQINQKDM